MNQSLLSLPNSQKNCLLKSDFHKIEKLITSKEKTFEITICSKSFFFSKEQIILFSIKALVHILNTNLPFYVSCLPDASEESLISCFNEIYLLFSSSEEFEISQDNVFIFQYFSEIFENSSLSLACKNVIKTDQSEYFFLTSEIFSAIPTDILDSFKKFKILLCNETIYCNSIFASLVSNYIFRQMLKDPASDLIDFSNYRYPEIIKLFFEILRGNVIQIDEIKIEQILDAINFLESDTLFVRSFLQNYPFNFVSKSTTSLFSLPNESIQSIISSPYFHLKNENQLFELLFEKIQKNGEFLFLLKYAYFGNVNFLDLNCLIQSIQYPEINESLFHHFKDSLFFNYLLSIEDQIQIENIQSLLSISKEIENFSQYEKENKEYKLLSQAYPILFVDTLEINPPDQTELLFTPSQQEFVGQFHFIQVINGTFKEFEESNVIIQDNSLLIFIPDSVTRIGNRCFFGCTSLSQISLPNTITLIGGECFSRCSSLSQISLPISLILIGDECFSGCFSLSQINLPNSITSIGIKCFLGSKSLSQINLPNSITSIGIKCLSGCSSLTQIILPNSIKSISNGCFSECSSLTQINPPNSITSIDDGSFLGCSSLSQINLPNSITCIGIKSFSGCSSLSQIVLPNSMTSIGIGCFSGCSSLSQINIPKSITLIGEDCFSGCTSLSQANIPEYAKLIGARCFSGCSLSQDYFD
jgi:hypothetical protein